MRVVHEFISLVCSAYRREVALLMLIIIPSFSIAQWRSDSIYTKEVLLEDLRELREIINDVHPGPYSYCSPEDVDRAWKAAEEAVNGGMNKEDFTLLLAKTLRVFRDSHTSLNFIGATADYAKDGGLFLGIKVLSNGDGIYLKEDLSERIPIGSEIITINGVSATKLHNQVGAYSMYEGNSITGFKRIADALFARYLGLLIDVNEMNEIIAIPPGKESGTKYVVPAYDKKTLQKMSKKVRPAMYELNLFEEDSLAVLRIGSFSWSGSGQYSRFLRRSFKKIKRSGIKHLAIDLRNNTGGSSNRMEELYAYLALDTPIVIPQCIIARQSSHSKERYDQQIKGWKRLLLKVLRGRNEDVKLFFHMAEMSIGAQDTVYYHQSEPWPKNHFSGESYLFMNGLSGSASANFAGVFKTLERGPVIGESCLGPLNGTWGNPVSVQLSKTGIFLLVSSIRFHISGKFRYDPRPVKPDIPAGDDGETLSQGMDPCLEQLRALIGLDSTQSASGSTE